MKTYIIDDEEISLYLTRFMLVEENFSDDITSFLSAEEALEVLLPDLATTIPQVIFLDLNMPGMNGWEFLDALTPYKEQLLGRCQIYVLTSSLDLNDMAKSKKYELICGFIHKAIGQADIKEILTHLQKQT